MDPKPSYNILAKENLHPLCWNSFYNVL